MLARHQIGILRDIEQGSLVLDIAGPWLRAQLVVLIDCEPALINVGADGMLKLTDIGRAALHDGGPATTPAVLAFAPPKTPPSADE